MQNQTMSIDEFEHYYLNSYCFVAMKEGKLIGTASLKIKTVKQWWVKGDVAYPFADAIIPEYRGTDVFMELQKLRGKCIKELGINILMFDTEENNKLVQKYNIKMGAKRIKLYASSKTWYYSVVMVKWLDGCPYSDWYCKFRFNLSKLLVRLIWKPGRIVRFLPVRDADYQRVYNHCLLCSKEMSEEDFCRKVEIGYNRYKKWKAKHQLIDNISG